jgi:hypothetical protein
VAGLWVNVVVSANMENIDKEICEYAMKLFSAAPAIYFITLTTDESQIIEVQRCFASGKIV